MTQDNQRNGGSGLTGRKLRCNDIVLDADTHTYRLLSKPDIEFQSCTEFVGSFFEPFEPARVAHKLVRMGKHQHRSVGSFLAEWQRDRDEGTEVHREIEQSLVKDSSPQRSRARCALMWLERNLPSSLVPQKLVRPLFCLR